ncbi:hypothetical protein B0H13DRAFT_760573 [Mycena leptocephala]|nr:hypothetical protein B0H13DRAFT_760573 [Mycena leptocephala]
MLLRSLIWARLIYLPSGAPWPLYTPTLLAEPLFSTSCVHTPRPVPDSPLCAPAMIPSASVSFTNGSNRVPRLRHSIIGSAINVRFILNARRCDDKRRTTLGQPAAGRDATGARSSAANAMLGRVASRSHASKILQRLVSYISFDWYPCG